MPFPRILGNGAIFDTYKYSGDNLQDFYKRFMSGAKVKAEWINQTDVLKQLL